MAEAEEKQFWALPFVFSEDDFHLDVRGAGTLPEGAAPEKLERDRYRMLYRAGFQEKPERFTATAGYLAQVCAAFLSALTSLPGLELVRDKAEIRLTEDQVRGLLESVPFAVGAEFVTEEWIQKVTDRLAGVYAEEIRAYDGTVAMYLAEKTQRLQVPERIYFHLVEQKDEEYPFAFLATYATTGDGGKLRHMPLKYALTEYQNDRERLLALLACLNRVAEVSPLISGFVESGEMFHPLRLTSSEAYEFLKDVEAIEKAGILCRIPNWWKKKSMVPAMSLRMGSEKGSLLGLDTIVSLQPQLVVDGEALTEDEIRYLLDQTEGLALLKGRWVEVNHEKLRALLDQMEEYPDSVTLQEALRMETGEAQPDVDAGPQISNGAWLSGLLADLRKPERFRSARKPRTLQAVLRPYQKTGYTWLTQMDSLGFGACLADDMGLGKTVQVLAFLERLRLRQKGARALLVAPASLLDNWMKEAGRFTPEMDILLLHGKTAPALEKMYREQEAFLTVTTYGMAARLDALQEREWDCLILDEAQAIKNPGSKQTRAVKKIPARFRIAMTGTPVENDLSNLWSLFDFLNRGLLGTSGEFKNYCRDLGDHPEGYQKLKAMISPFMLRRVKTDKSIIRDLPEKMENIEYVSLTKKQVVLYRKEIADLQERVENTDGIGRRGLVLSSISKLKQICNHPDQFLGQTAFEEKESGKLQMLREICETVREKGERVIVFTQFREITGYLADFLRDVFGMDGCVLHGGTPVKQRAAMVEKFQGDMYVPFMVISLKAGGTGLNLTKANHVVHFDRWWNPAVENQATDRAFRIGQTKDVMVYKLVCQGTVEEKIDAMIREKTDLAENVIGSGGEQWITELSNEELMSLLRLEPAK